MVGCQHGVLAAAVARRATPVLTACVCLLYASLTCTATLSSALAVPGVRPALGLLGVTAGVLAASQVASSRPGRLLQQVGQRTLPIYVAHELLLGLLVLAVRPFVGSTLGPLAPPAMALTAVGAALVLHSLLSGVPALYAPPGWASRQRPDDRRSSPHPS